MRSTRSVRVVLDYRANVGASPFDGIDATAEALLEVILDASSQALFSYATDGCIASWNRGAERIFGHPAGDVVGTTLVSMFPARLQREIERLSDATRAGERVDRVVVEIERPDGMTIPIALSLCPVAASDGTPAGCVAIVDDLTETRLGQAALAEVEARLREWEALAHVGRWLWDVGTGSVQWSDELHRMHGIEPSDFEGTLDAHLMCIHAVDRDRVRSLMEGAVVSGHSFDDIYRVVERDGETRWFEMRAEPTVGSSGTVVGLRGVSRDRARASATAGEESHSVQQV
jgi:PAS domain S-box-containing protein